MGAYNKKIHGSYLSLGLVLIAVLALVWCGGAWAQQVPILGNTIPKYVDPLPDLDVVSGSPVFTLSACEFKANVLSSTFVPTAGAYTGTWVWGYKEGGICPTVNQPTYIGPVVVANRGVETTVAYRNRLGTAAASNLPFYTVDQTVHWADPGSLMCSEKGVDCVATPADPCCQKYAGAIPVVAHLHGGQTPSEFDGGPDQWFTSTGLRGEGYRSASPAAADTAIYKYGNTQEPAPIWFHDHALGATRLNVYSGLAGAYLITDPPNEPANLPDLIPLVVQDRIFDASGQFYFPAAGVNPDVHPFWIPEFFGDVIVVNGKSWPIKDVEPRRYRLLFINGSNARFYDMLLQTAAPGPGPGFWVISTDGGYLDAPVSVGAPASGTSLLIAPGERYVAIVDFSAYAGQTLTLVNSANAPFPGGDPVDPSTNAQIMQFRVSAAPVADATCNPAAGGCVRPAPMVRLADPTTGAEAVGVVVNRRRQLTLNENGGAGGPLEVLVNNTSWSGKRPDDTAVPGGVLLLDRYLTELPQIGSTEVWEIVNMTEDAHPIHLHLVQFQALNRQAYNATTYEAAYNALFPGGAYIPAYGPPMNYNSTQKLGGNPDVTPYLQGAISVPKPEEAGWKDTLVMWPGQVTRVIVRWAPQDKAVGTVTPGDRLVYGFDATGQDKISFDKNNQPAGGPGYVFHCHIIDHEDNEMMRPYLPVVSANNVITDPPPVISGGGGGGGGACFIATAAYGSYLDPHVQVLREFRDRWLMTNALGKRFVAFYYHYSPPLATIISEHPLLRLITRIVLTPLVYALAYPSLFIVLLALGVFATGWRTARRWKSGACHRIFDNPATSG